jgi:uncharacterized membrane protein
MQKNYVIFGIIVFIIGLIVWFGTSFNFNGITNQILGPFVSGFSVILFYYGFTSPKKKN